MDRMKQLPKERILREWQSLHGPFFLFLTYYIISQSFHIILHPYTGGFLETGSLTSQEPGTCDQAGFDRCRASEICFRCCALVTCWLMPNPVPSSNFSQDWFLTISLLNFFLHYFSYNGWFQQAKTLYITDWCETVRTVGGPFSMRCSLCMFLLASTVLRCCGSREGSELSVHCWRQRCRKDWPARSRSRPRPDVVAVDTGASDIGRHMFDDKKCQQKRMVLRNYQTIC